MEKLYSVGYLPTGETVFCSSKSGKHAKRDIYGEFLVELTPEELLLVMSEREEGK